MDGFDDAAYREMTDLLYETVTDDSRWSQVGRLVKARLASSTFVFGYWDASTGRQLLLHGDCDDEFRVSFASGDIENPFAPVMAHGAVGHVFTDSMLMSRDELARSPFYNEWLRPQGEHTAMQVSLWRNGQAGAHFGLTRGGRQDAYAERDVATLRSLLPTLERVVALRASLGATHLGRLAAENDALGTGLLVTDDQGRIVYANAAAEQFISDPASELHAHHRMLKLGGRLAERLRRALFSACDDGLTDVLVRTGDILVTERETGRGLATLSVLPLVDAPLLGLPIARAALVLLRRLQPEVPAGLGQRLRNLYGLTQREAELAESMFLGVSVQDFAARRDLSLPTARTYLAGLFRKTDTSRQGELVALLHRIGRPY